MKARTLLPSEATPDLVTMVRAGRTSPLTGPTTFASPSNQVYGTHPKFANA